MSRITLIIISILISFHTLGDTTIKPNSGDTWEMFVLGGGGVFFDLFNAVKLFVDSTAFTSLIAFFALLGFLILMTQNVGQLDPKKIGIYFILVWGVSFATNELKVNIQVIDSIALDNNSTIGVPPVEGVPAAIGLPAAWVSTMGEYFTQMIEVSFTHADSALKFTNTKKLNMEAQVIKDMMAIHPFSPNLTKSLSAFYTDCVYPLIANGNVDLVQLVNSPNYMDDVVLTELNPAITTIDYTDGGQVKGCTEAYTGADGYGAKINTAVTDVITKPYNMHPERDAIVASGSLADLSHAIMSHITTSGASTSASDVVKNRAITRAFDQGNESFGRRLGSDGNMTQLLIEEQAIQQQKSGWRMAIEAFNSMSAYIFTVLHAFIIGISPIMLVLAFIPGLAGKILLNYFQVLFWLALWQPMLCIVNYIVVSFQNEALRTSLLYGDTAINLSVASPSTWAAVTEAADKYVLAAGFLGTMVPMISWGLVKGGMAFSQFIASGIGTSVAQGAAKNLASGSLSMDSKSFNTTSGNSHNTAYQGNTGVNPYKGSIGFGNMSQIDAVSGRSGTIIGEDRQKFSQKLAQSTIDQHTVQAGTSVAESLQAMKAKTFNNDYAKLEQLSDSYMASEQGQRGEKSGRAWEALDTFRKQRASQDNGDYQEALDTKLSLQQSKNAGALLLTAPMEGGSTLEEKFKNGENVDFDTAKKHYEKMYDSDARVRAEAEKNGWTKEQAADAFAYVAGKSDQNLTEDRERDLQKVAGASAMLSGVKGLIKAIPEVGSVVDALPDVKVTGSASQSSTTGYTQKQSLTSGTTAENAEATKESIAKDMAFLESYQENVGFTTNEGKTDRETDSTQNTVTQLLQKGRSVQRAINDAETYTAEHTLNDQISGGEWNQYKNEMLKGFKEFEATKNGEHLGTRDPNDVDIPDAELNAGSASSSDIEAQTSGVTGATTGHSQKAETEKNLETEKEKRTFDPDTKKREYKADHETYSEDELARQGESLVAKDKFAEEVINRNTYNEQILNDLRETGAQNRANIQGTTGKTTDSLETMENTDPQISAQHEAYAAVAGGGVGSVAYAELSDSDKISVGNNDQFTASHVQFTKGEGEGKESVSANIIYSDEDGGLYELDDKGNMQRLEESIDVKDENNFVVQNEDGTAKQQEIYAKDTLDVDGSVYEEYGKDLNGEQLFVNADNPETPMTQAQIEKAHGVTSETNNEGRVKEEINVNDLENDIDPSKLNDIIPPQKLQDTTGDDMKSAYDKKKAEEAKKLEAETYTRENMWNHTSRQ